MTVIAAPSPSHSQVKMLELPGLSDHPNIIRCLGHGLLPSPPDGYAGFVATEMI